MWDKYDLARGVVLQEAAVDATNFSIVASKLVERSCSGNVLKLVVFLDTERHDESPCVV